MYGGLGQIDISPYMNAINPSTGLNWTQEQVATATGLSIDQVYALVSAFQTQDMINKGLLTPEPITLDTTGAYAPGYVAGAAAAGVPVYETIAGSSVPVSPDRITSQTVNQQTLLPAPAPAPALPGPVTVTSSATAPADSSATAPGPVNVNVPAAPAAPSGITYYNAAGQIWKTGDPVSYWFDYNTNTWSEGHLDGSIQNNIIPPFGWTPPGSASSFPGEPSSGISFGLLAVAVGAILLLRK